MDACGGIYGNALSGAATGRQYPAVALLKHGGILVVVDSKATSFFASYHEPHMLVEQLVENHKRHSDLTGPRTLLQHVASQAQEDLGQLLVARGIAPDFCIDKGRFWMGDALRYGDKSW